MNTVQVTAILFVNKFQSAVEHAIKQLQFYYTEQNKCEQKCNIRHVQNPSTMLIRTFQQCNFNALLQGSFRALLQGTFMALLQGTFMHGPSTGHFVTLPFYRELHDIVLHSVFPDIALLEGTLDHVYKALHGMVIFHCTFECTWRANLSWLLLIQLICPASYHISVEMSRQLINLQQMSTFLELNT